MEEMRKEYTLLFNGITEAINSLENTITRLKLLQQAAENTYLDSVCTGDKAPEEEEQTQRQARSTVNN